MMLGCVHHISNARKRLFIVTDFHNIQLTKRVKLQSRKSIGFPFFVRVCGARFDFSISSHHRRSKNVDDSATHR